MIRVFIDGISAIAPGLGDWASGRPILAGGEPYRPGDMPRLAAARLPAAERRRATAVTRLALEAAEQAIPDGVDPATLTTVFASSGGEVDVIHRIFCELATVERQISPTLFHNSVHNAASGYWSIATGSRRPSTSLSCFDDTFAAGLLEAGVQAVTESCPVLLVAYDAPPDAPIARFRPMLGPFGTGLLLYPRRTAHSLMELRVMPDPSSAEPVTRLADAGLEALRANNPAARSLPLLAAIARNEPARVLLQGNGRGVLCIEALPCN